MVRLPQFLVGMLMLALVFGLATPAFADSVNGTVRSTNPDRNEVTLKGIVKDTTYIMDKTAWVVLDGTRVLKEGDKAHIDYNKINDTLVATGVRALRNASETNGTVKFVISDKNELVLKGTVKDSVYHLEKNTNVYIGAKQGKLADVREGDEVAVTYTSRDGQYFTNEIRVTAARK
jgi:tRNA G26 N,N-dimethylase Trm1